jgi:hypothetical protein
VHQKGAQHCRVVVQDYDQNITSANNSCQLELKIQQQFLIQEQVQSVVINGLKVSKI